MGQSNNELVNRYISKFISLDETSCEAEAIALGRRGDSGFALLEGLMAASEVDARFWAVRGLWANGSSKAVAKLIEALQDKEEIVRSGAAMALGELKAGAAVQALARLVTGDASASGNYAANALGKIGPPAAAALIEALQNEQPWVRVRAAKALVPIESRQAIGPLFYALEDESYMVRHYAEIALERMGVGQMIYFK